VKYFILRLNLLFALGIFAFTNVNAQGRKITFEIKNYQSNQMILAYHNGDKQFIADTLEAKSPGVFVSENAEELQQGMYIAFFPSVGKSFDFLLNKGEQNFTLSTDLSNAVGNMKVKDSAENERFFGYLGYLGTERNKRNGVSTMLDKLKKEKGDEAKIKELEAELKKIDEAVVAYQKNIVEKYPSSFTAGIIKINTPVDIPEAVRKDTTKTFYYYRSHFWDNTNFADERFVYSPMLFQKVDLYISDKVTIPNPDSAIVMVDYLLNKADANEEVFKYFLARLLNHYAKSKIICMDAVYVHLVDNYYSKGRAEWLDVEQLKKIEEDAAALRPLLCNKKAPDVIMQTFDKPAKPVNLHGIKAKYTVLFMWDPDCGHCKKSMPDMVKFYDDFKPKGVEVFAVCTKTYKGEAECIKTIEEKDMKRWLNVIDPYYRSRYKLVYNVKSTPVIYILDENKMIIAKRIGADQIATFMDRIIERDNKIAAENTEKGIKKKNPNLDMNKVRRVQPVDGKAKQRQQSID
jgi:thiol-disulfide isomerase/thioredoxin